ncbi:pancreatic secretory granule membrane major glycoprotein GP2-like [Hyperolius riggenbachi]|uniref:pancreatic secretory granule membrane major glycoprotein GP2-like n=1 Tax=Hyperolius riggenbachi TaxID=752182 RepID=UPI0035A3B00E
MAGFTGSTFSTPITETTELFIDSTIYVSVTAGGLDASVFKVKVTDIYATPGDVNTPQYYLLKDGCPVTTGDAAGLLHVVSNGVDAESRFEVQVFQIAGSPTVNLYAQAVLCTSNCTVDCTGRAARDSSSDGPSATVDLRLAALAYDYPISSSSAVSWMLSTLIMSWGFVKLL